MRRKLFHAARVGPWGLLVALVLLAILTSAISVWQEDLDVKDFGGVCIPVNVVAGIVFFAALLVNDLLWLGLVFWSLHTKPFLILHHCIYIVWVIITVHGDFQYVHLVFSVSALEESQELMASICYLMKDSKSGQRWRFFTIAWRMMCCSFAIGVMALFLMLGTARREMIIFVLVEIALWCIFLWQEWSFLAELVLKNMPAPGEDNDGNSASGNAEVDVEHMDTRSI